MTNVVAENGYQPLHVTTTSQIVEGQQREQIEVENNYEEGEEVDIDPDVYGATIFVLIWDVYELFSGVDHDGLSLHINVYRVAFVNVLLFGNYFVQIGLLCWIYKLVALPQVHDAQNVYKRFHAEVFRDGIFDEDLWSDWDGKEHVCNVCFSNFPFMYTILALWWITMLIELNKTYLLLSKLSALQHVVHIKDMLQNTEVGEDGYLHRRIIGLTSCLRTLLFVVLIVPKTFIALGLLVVGTIWLAATDSVVNLILNAITLNFVIGIDENLFEGFIPESMRKNISLTTFKFFGNEKEMNVKHVMCGYARSTAYLVIVLGGVYTYMVYGQGISYIGIFPGFQSDVPCAQFWADQASMVCRPGEECFPKG
jgi:hypothetical protein